MKEWIEAHGGDALQRAFGEGYDIKKGVAEQLVCTIGDALSLELFRSWQLVEERTSPRAETFAKRDEVCEVVAALVVPPGWTVEVSRISRITFGEDKTTGVMIAMRDGEYEMILHVGVDFESN